MISSVKYFQISRAIETIRSYITMTDITLLPMLVNLQKGLTGIAAKKKLKENLPSDSNQSSDSAAKQQSCAEEKVAILSS